MLDRIEMSKVRKAFLQAIEITHETVVVVIGGVAILLLLQLGSSQNRGREAQQSQSLRRMHILVGLKDR